jgi:hypothetical protein
VSRPDLTVTAHALRTTDPRVPHVQPTPDETEVADLLQELAELHQPTRDEPDNPTDKPILHTYGACLGCTETWPCKAWVYGEQLALQWVGRAIDRINHGGTR